MDDRRPNDWTVILALALGCLLVGAALAAECWGK